MGLEEVKKAILAKAQKQASELIKEGEGEANVILKEAKTRITEYEHKAEQILKQRKEELQKMSKAGANNEAKKKLLDAKKDAIEHVFSVARAKILKAGKSKKEEYLTKLLAKAKKELDVAMVFCCKAELGLLAGVEVHETGIQGGIVAENEEGTMRLDYSYETLLEMVKEKELQHIGQMLF